MPLYTKSFMFCEFELIPLLVAVNNHDLWCKIDSTKCLNGMVATLIDLDYDDDRLCFKGVVVCVIDLMVARLIDIK